MGNLFRAQGLVFEEKSRLDRDLYAADGGCFPVLIRRVGAVGTITVSGLPQAEDHELLVRVLRAFLAGPEGGPGPEAMVSIAPACLERLHHSIDAEAGWLLARWELLEAL